MPGCYKKMRLPATCPLFSTLNSHYIGLFIKTIHPRLSLKVRSGVKAGRRIAYLMGMSSVRRFLERFSRVSLG